MTAAPDDVLAPLRWRYATKAFDPARTIDPATWAALEQAAVLAPSSFGLQPWAFVVVTDPAVREQLHPASWNQSQVLDASHLVVFAAKNPPTASDVARHVANAERVRGQAPGSLDALRDRILGTLAKMSPADAHAWAARQCYIALGVFLAAAAHLGVDACPMEGFQPDQYDDILGLTAKGLRSVVLATAGYRSANDKYAAAAKVRFPVDEVVIRV
ncbi:MAG TPA: NAD(P)H-dependent oxidoreductase [Urbifossiella sp.]|nr:NAD(P)H-dependent oxidoreductase [Urbifossiella sp.]